MLRIRKTNDWVRETISVPENEGLLEMVKKRKISKYGHWKHRGDSFNLVLSTTCILRVKSAQRAREEDDTSG